MSELVRYFTDPWIRDFRYGMIYYPWLAAPLSHLYSLAITNGILKAHENHAHSFKESPWTHLKPRSNRILMLLCAVAPPWLLLGLTINLDGDYSEMWRAPYYCSALYFSHVGLFCLILATNTILAPRVRMPVLLTVTGTAFGTLVWSVSWRCLTGWASDADEAPPFFFLFGFLGITALASVWLYVRYGVNENWFQFDSSDSEPPA